MRDGSKMNRSDTRVVRWVFSESVKLMGWPNSDISLIPTSDTVPKKYKNSGFVKNKGKASDHQLQVAVTFGGLDDEDIAQANPFPVLDSLPAQVEYPPNLRRDTSRKNAVSYCKLRLVLPKVLMIWTQLVASVQAGNVAGPGNLVRELCCSKCLSIFLNHMKLGKTPGAESSCWPQTHYCKVHCHCKKRPYWLWLGRWWLGQWWLSHARPVELVYWSSVVWSIPSLSLTHIVCSSKPIWRLQEGFASIYPDCSTGFCTITPWDHL